MVESAAVDPNDRLAAALGGCDDLARMLALVRPEIERGFPGATLADWIDTCRGLIASGTPASSVLAYVRNAPACAAMVGPEAAIALGASVRRLGAGAGAGAQGAAALSAAAPLAARILGSSAAFLGWLRVIERIAELAPESIAALLDQTGSVLGELDVTAFEAWALGGILAAAGNGEQRLAYFSLRDPAARRWLDRGAGDVALSDVERRLKAYLTALWRIHPALRAAGGSGQTPQRRSGFEGGIVRIPETYRGVRGSAAAALFRAVVAHLGAHLVFGGPKFPVGSLKPLQIALVSLIEDARVEQLAIAALPGLRRLWLPFHVAEPASGVTAPILMARLARALIDPDYRDDNAWVDKGRRLFDERRRDWADPALSRAIGGLLGNDLGQMRVQFNARTYVVEPAYRDDNLGLWDFSQAAQGSEAETINEGVRFDQVEDETTQPDREREAGEAKTEQAHRARLVAAPDEDAGIPVAHYPEWDYLIGRERRDWATLVEFPAVPGPRFAIDRVLERHGATVNRIEALIRSAKVSRPVRLRRQPEGDRLDLEACIGAEVNRRQGEVPDPRVYMTLERRHRDLSALVLLDVSQSTNDIVRGTEVSVLTLEREAAALLGVAMAGLGDPFAIHAFCSNGRGEVRYYRVKDFNASFDVMAKRRLAGLSGAFSTRIGAAMRHAGMELARQRSHRRLLLVVTDGEPSDIDVGDRRYLVEDARKSVMSLNHAGIDVFCVGLDAGGDSYLSRMFGRRNVVQIDRVERLPEKLPMLYLRLTA